MASPLFYSQASNFIDSLQGGVDPRTGNFGTSLQLVNFHPNNLVGPEVVLSLKYSPQSSVNEGFGLGFMLNLTQYNTRTGELYLSTGEQYRVSNSGSAVQQQKFKNFVFEKTSGNTFRVIYKSGLVETLTSMGSIACLDKISDSFGRTIYFEWSHNNSKNRLTSVSDVIDNSSRLLCKITYPDEKIISTTIEVLPDNIDFVYKIIFSFNNELLTQVTNLADSPNKIWKFEYDSFVPKGNTPLVNEIVYPTGLSEKVEYMYGAGAAEFPDGIGLSSLPRVKKHIITPGGGQPAVTTVWEWTANNYLGKNMPSPHAEWQPNMDLMLLLTLKPGYFYGSVAKTMDKDGEKILSKVTRSYNSYHLLVSESTLRDGKEYSVKTEYYAKQNAPFSEQPSQYLLPRIKTETWKANDSTRTRSTRWTFDPEGNILSETAPDGTVTSYSYYPVEGEENTCPADPHGFIRYLKQKKIIPSKVHGDEYEIVTLNTWKKQILLEDTSYVVVGDKVTETAGNTQTVTSREYYDDSADRLTFGREKKRVTIMTPDITVSTSYSSEETYTYVNTALGLLQTVKAKSCDGLFLQHQNCRHPYFGYLLSEMNAQGIRTTYTYDKNGLVRQRKLATDTEWESNTTYEYALEATGLVTTETDGSGNGLKTFFDGAGRVIKQQRLDKDATLLWFDISTSLYKLTGELAQVEVCDVESAIPTKYYRNATRYSYDGWGNISERTFSDGVTVSLTTDPIGCQQSVVMKGSDSSKELNTWKKTTSLYKSNELPQFEDINDADGKSQGHCYFAWDGLGFLRELTDERQHTIKWAYDLFGRVLTQTLADGTVISRTYAPHLTGEQITSISVTGKNRTGDNQTWILGKQEFDGFGRLKKRVSGGRTTLFTYDTASPVPASVTLPSGKIINYKYIPELNNVLKSLTANDVSQTFTYDPLTRKQLTSTEGNTQHSNKLNPSGTLKSETFVQGETTKTAAYIRTLAGIMTEYSDIADKKIIYERNNFGQVINVADEAMHAKITYDLLGRLSKLEDTTSKLPSYPIDSSLSYDGAGRETNRSIYHAQVPLLNISQTWEMNSLLAGRVTKEGNKTVKDEQYEYDARNRLVRYTLTGSRQPEDGYGNKMTGQAYKYDALNNLTEITTTLKDGSIDTATYYYDNVDDPTQLTSVKHTHPTYPPQLSLKYDTEGRMTQDEAGRTLQYDVIGRLIGASGGNITKATYGYDALNRLVNQAVSDNDTRQLYYREGDLVNEIVTPQNKITRLIKVGSVCLGVNNGTNTTFTSADHHNSLLLTLAPDGQGESYDWSPYGGIGMANTMDLLPGFNGERADPLKGMYQLGNGYRTYNTVLMRFNCPDELSPFGAGGINPYAYCAGDPINLTDPSGRSSYLMSILTVAFAIAGIAAAALSAGISIAAAGGILAAISAASTTALIMGGIGVAADVTSIASVALEDAAPQASNILGWISFAAGVSALSAGVGRPFLGRMNGASSIRQTAEDTVLLLRGNRSDSVLSGLDEVGTAVSDASHVVSPASIASSPLRLRGGGDRLATNNYSLDDTEQLSRFLKKKHIRVPEAAMRKYNDWKRLVRDQGMNPKTAANSVSDANPEKLQGDTYSFRLSQEHRVVYTLRGREVIVHSVGGHYVRQ